MQYGNLKMKEAFSKADNVLATAAKCITDVINSRGHIIVDFADVCTVMRNGGVAILGKAEVEGENRAQLAIEEALSSPLLNDSDIKGAKWILININSAEGEHECTMDELEIINNHLRLQAGENADVIVGMGYDNTLDKKIGITLVATGFKQKDPFAKPEVVKQEEAKPEKIVMTLKVDHPAVSTGVITATKDAFIAEPAPAPVVEVAKEQIATFAESLIPFVAEEPTVNPEPATPAETTPAPEKIYETLEMPSTASPVIVFDLAPAEPVMQTPPAVHTFEEEVEEKLPPIPTAIHSTFTGSALSKPANIYASEMPATPQVPPVVSVPQAPPVEEEANLFDMQLVEKPEGYSAPQATMSAAPSNESADNSGDYFDDVEEQKRRAAERIQKLRNLSFNMNNSSDLNGEFDAVPAYVRRNMELFGNTLTSVENFYSKYTVGKDENNQTQINTINTFLDGKKPD